MLDQIVQPVQHVLGSLPMFLILFVGIFISKWFCDVTTTYKFNEELTEKDNSAFGIFLACYLIGSAIALSGTIFGIDEFTKVTIIDVVIYSALVIGLMRASVLVNDKLILNKFSIHKEMIQDKNAGVGWVVGGSSIATGLVLLGSLSGESDTVVDGVVDVLIYFILAQVLLIIGGKVMQKITAYDIHHVIGEDDNQAAGISFAGFLIGLGIINYTAVKGAGTDVVAEIPGIVVISLIGMILLVAGRVFADKILLPKAALSDEISEDKNTAAAAIAFASFILIGIAYSTVVSAGLS